MSYKVIEKNEFGIRVRNYSGISDCNLCRNVAGKSTCKRNECAPNSYYLPDSEVEKLESEKTLSDEIIGIQNEKIKMLEDTLKQVILSEKAKNEELIKFLEENIEKSKNTETHYKIVAKKRSSDVNWAMGQAYKNVLEFIKNQK